MRRGQFPDMPEHCTWLGDKSISEVGNHCFWVRFGQTGVRSQESLDLGSKEQPTGPLSIEKRFLTQPISRQQKPMGTLIPESNPEHTTQVGQGVSTLFFIGVRDHLGI